MPKTTHGLSPWGIVSFCLIAGSLGIVVFGLWQERSQTASGPNFQDSSESHQPITTIVERLAATQPPLEAEGADGPTSPSGALQLDTEFSDIITTTAVIKLDGVTTGPSGAVNGYVINEFNEPVAGAELRLLPLAMYAPMYGQYQPPVEDYREVAREEAIATVKSERDGFFAFEKLELGRYEIFAEHPDYAPSWESNFILLDGETLPGVEVRLAQGIALEGRVVDPNGNPIPKALVRVSLRMKRLIATGGEYVYVLIPYDYESTDEDGQFTLGGLSAGENFITISKAGWFPAEEIRKVQKKNAGPALKVTLQPASEIGGVIVGPDESLVAGASVTLKTMFDSSGAKMKMPSKTMSAKTDGEGRFNIGPLPQGVEVDLLVEKSGLIASYFYRLQSGTLNNRLQMAAGGQIGGAVVDMDTGDLVPGLKVILTRLPKGPDIPFTPVHTETDAEGRYLFWGVPEGTYRLDLDTLDWVSSPRNDIALKAKQSRLNIDFDVYRPMTMTGRVINLETDTGIPGATVAAKGFYGPGYKKSRDSKTTTDENGVFALTDLLPGQWRLTAQAPGFFFNPTDRSNTVWLKRTEAAPTDIVLEMEPAGELSGTVYTPDGYPCEKARVVISYGKKSTETDSSGFFSFNDINVARAQTIRAYAWREGFAPGVSEPVILSQSDRRQTTEIDLGNGFLIEGKVVDEDDLPIHRAQVRLSQHNYDGYIGDVNQETRTDVSGRFVFAPVAPGSITVAASAEGRAGASRRVTVRDNGDYPELTLQLRRGFEIAGTVLDDFSQPVKGAQVTALGVPGLGNVSATSENDGTFVIKNLREGSFPIQCVWTRVEDKVKHVYRERLPEVATGSAAVRIIMHVNGTFEGTVFSAESLEPVPSFTVEFRAKCPMANGGTYDFAAAQNFTSGYGRFFKTYLPTGTYTVRVSASGFVPDQKENLVLASQSQVQIGDIFLETAGGLTGTVIDSTTGNGVSGARVTALPTSVGKAANTDYSGFFNLTGLARGSYALRVTSAAHLPVETQTFNVLEGESNDVGRIYIEPGAAAKGRVVTAIGDGIANIKVEARSASITRSANTDAAGYYEIQGLNPGGVDFLVTGTVGAHKFRRRFVAQLTAGLDNQVNFVMDNSYDVTGEIMGAPPLSSAGFTLYPLGEEGDPNSAWALQGVAGQSPATFSVQSILNGRYLMCWRGQMAQTASSGQSADLRWMQTVDVSSRKMFLTIDPGVRAVAGEVMSDATGEVQSGVKVRLVKTDLTGGGGNIPADFHTWNAVTDDNGLYEFAMLPTGRYRITFTTEDDKQFYTDLLITPADAVVDLNVEF